ncbi:protein GAMETE EXPRESSED 1-like [Coffea arabica]|uniref:Protein GAMETE EXPRESSED 1-like n=1 Tax=Coffea arabica TaxID=13443 RepID=A0ABM4WSE7_COFAR
MMTHDCHKLNYNWLSMVFLIMVLQVSSSWGWFFSSNKESNNAKGTPLGENMMFSKDSVAEFSMEPFNNQRGTKLVENARNKMIAAAPSSCWQKAYQSLFTGCSRSLADEESRNRFAWHLTECFLKHSGRSPLPYCDKASLVEKCLKQVDQDAVKIYLEYHLETNSICHQLQIEAFRHQTERLVNELKKSAEYAEEKLESIEERGELLLQSSKNVHDALTNVDLRTQQLAEASKDVENHVNLVLNYSKAVHEQSLAIAASQAELSHDQVKMKESLDEGMAMLHDSYTNLGREITNLRDEAVEIEKEISRVGDEMSSKMNTLQTKADDIGNMAESSIEKQKQLLDGQSMALSGLHLLTETQSKALEESRGTLEKLAEFGHRQQDELLQRQKQLQQAHDHLVANSKTILAAQEAFESKQASMFLALDKLFALHNAMLLESRMIKAFVVYTLSFFLLYMLTSTKQTYNVRHRVYIGLSITLLIELLIIRWTSYDIEKQGEMIFLIRFLSGALVLFQLGCAIYTYRDFEVLNHQMLLSLMEKVNWMQKERELSWDTDADSEVGWSSWVDTDLADDVDKLEDPDYVCREEVGENSVETTSITKRYNLRSRR